MKLKFSSQLSLLIGLILLWSVGTQQAWAGAAATTTTLTVTSGGNVVISGKSLASGSQVTLTAAVVSGSSKVTAGQVKFCDASVSYCTDIHLLGTAQLTNAGTAVLNLRAPIGSHRYKAVFDGTLTATPAYAGSASSSIVLTATGNLWPTATTIAQSGKTGGYSLTGTVGSNAPTAPSGTVSFLNASDSNAVLGSAALGSGTAGLNFLAASSGIGNLPFSTEYGGAVAVGDFNGDGFLDVAFTYSAGCTTGQCSDAGVVVLLGNGDGSFKALAPLDLGTGIGIVSVAVGDFNGDGISDLAIGVDATALSPEQEVEIILGNGDGTFSAKGTAPIGGNFQSLVASDFNGDGIQDLAVVNTTADIVTVLLGKGDGTFTPSTAAVSSSGSNPTTMAVGDFNGDGIPDLAIANDNSPDGALIILLGNGDGTFTTAASPATGGDPNSIAVADFNGDGNLDLAATNEEDGTVTVLLGNGNGTFTAAQGSPIALYAQGPNLGPNFIAAGDFNGDGKIDLIAGANSESTATASIVPLLGNGDGTFSATAQLNDGQGIGAVGDFNDDGRTDLVSAGTESVSVGVVTVAVSRTSTATANGIAVPPATGTQQVIASYPGDANNAANISLPISLAAAQDTPQVTVQIAPNPASFGTSVTLTATVTGSGIAPTGTVTFYDGSLKLGSSALNSGIATYSSSSIAKGSNSITASYGGDSNYVQTNSSAVVLTITAALLTPTVTVTPSATSITAAQTLTVTVALSGATGGATPSGSVTLASGSYTAQQTLATGTATFTIAPGTLNSGSDILTATYSGDGIYAAATGTATVTVSPVGMAIPAPAPISPGATATATATLTASDSYTGTLNLTCALTTSPTGAQSLPTCSLNPTSVTLKAGASGTSTLTVATTAASANARLAPSGKSVWGFEGGGVVLAGLLMCGVSARRRRWLPMLSLLCIVATSLIIGCNGGSPATTGQGTSATTAGNYVFTITGTDSAQATIKTSTTVTVTVQ
jgi:hypothetical protein